MTAAGGQGRISRKERIARAAADMPAGHPELLTRKPGRAEWKLLAAWCAQLWPHDEYTAIVAETMRRTGRPGREAGGDHHGNQRLLSCAPVLRGAHRQALKTTPDRSGDGRPEMNCRGLHCPGCHRSGPGGPMTALLVLLGVSAAARAVAHPAHPAAHPDRHRDHRHGGNHYHCGRPGRPAAYAARSAASSAAAAARACRCHLGCGQPPAGASRTAGTAIAPCARCRPGHIATTCTTPGQRKDTTGMTRPHQPEPSPPPGTRPPEYVSAGLPTAAGDTHTCSTHPSTDKRQRSGGRS
jgi:hypothetical protein